MAKKLTLEDVKNSHVAEAGSSAASNVDELHQEISVCSLIIMFAFIDIHLCIYVFLHMVLLGVISRKSVRRYKRRKSCWKSSESEWMKLKRRPMSLKYHLRISVVWYQGFNVSYMVLLKTIAIIHLYLIINCRVSKRGHWCIWQIREWSYNAWASSSWWRIGPVSFSMNLFFSKLKTGVVQCFSDLF